MTKVAAVIFDIGNVLIEWQPERYYDRIIGPDRRRAFFGAFDFHGLMNKIDECAPFAPTINAAMSETPEWAQELAILRDNWCDLAQPEIPHSVRLLTALKSNGVPVFVLSNFGAENFPMSQEQFPFLTLFDRFYISGRMKMRKPHAEIYDAVERDCGLPPEQLLFADDRQDNIDAAHARGWQTHLFDDPKAWAACLVSAGVLTADDAR